jgi:hypothetical protein
MIVDAYESGMGHGLAGDGMDIFKTPHGNPDHSEAYELGYNLGQSRRIMHTAEKAKRHAVTQYKSLWFQPSESQIEGIPDFIEISLQDHALAALKIRRLFDNDYKAKLFADVKGNPVIVGMDEFLIENPDRSAAAIAGAIKAHAIPEDNDDTDLINFIEELAKDSYTGLTIRKADNPKELELMWHHNRAESHGTIRGAIQAAEKKLGRR